MKRLFNVSEPIGAVNNPCDLFNKISKINIDYKQENFLLFCLNTKNEVIKGEVVFIGGLDACSVDLKTIFRKALTCNSRKIIIAHNHPSNSLKSSLEDKEVFDSLKEVGEVLGLEVLDNIIFNEKEYRSFKDDEI